MKSGLRGAEHVAPNVKKMESFSCTERHGADPRCREDSNVEYDIVRLMASFKKQNKHKGSHYGYQYN
ncbi:hypothetical protein TNCV_968911 [Trichonephila clavipes]|nr:hypothetical protein TNCV_968851 [Trichonephila clavipes]GFV57326.1 hypothetical protein TNCV_968871 [Trichonephila clavipes]GFV57328.1 hypothetical protein TNCV_968891 [Trichonephila clavipes]GFV57330.1 hypothetical protein TNCV_968911 [Trichonephila clavipes]